MMKEPYAIHWFRRDLRVPGNEILDWLRQKYKGRVIGLFCFDKLFLSRKDFSCNRFQFFLETLKSLKKDLRKMGGDLLLLDTGPLESFDEIFKVLKQNNIELPETISWNRDYEPFALKRDRKMISFFKEMEVSTYNGRDHLIIEPHEITKGSKGDEGYKVYTPFYNKWIQKFQEESIQTRITFQKRSLSLVKEISNGKYPKLFSLTWTKLLKNKNKFPDYLEKYIEQNKKAVTISIPKAGNLEAFELLRSFSSRVKNYTSDRDFPSIKGTSGLSLFLKNGSISTGQIVSFLNLNPFDKNAHPGKVTFLKEIVWREFYYHILFHFPYVEKEAFKPSYRTISWSNNKTHFKAWKEGQTGFPIVDAGMRQLRQTGWMHNRVRMIVASFLTKDLLIDWKWGEKYFMEQLLDGDLAPNNGGWQWAASTGCDSQPYFRIFNPWTQGQKFDPDAEYIKKYIPELKEFSPKEIHSGKVSHKSYPNPIVDHKVQREKALKLYKEL